MNNIANFLTKFLDNDKHTYLVNNGEIYRYDNTNNYSTGDFKVFIDGDNFFIVGEATVADDSDFIDDESLVDDLNTFHFYTRYNHEHCMALAHSKKDGAVQVYNTMIQNLELLQKPVKHFSSYGFNSKYCNYGNRFLLEPHDELPILIPSFTLIINENNFNFELPSKRMDDIQKNVNFVNDVMWEYFFKSITPNTFDKMTEEEKDLIRMYYTS